MNARCGMWLRGATTALLGTLLLLPTGAFADVPGPSDAPAAAEATTLVLQPVCRRGDLYRLAVVNDAGPATVFTVAVDDAAAGGIDADVAIGEGETVHFWVDAAVAAPVEITWPDGSAAATPVGGPCTADGASANPPSGEDTQSAPAADAPSSAVSRVPQPAVDATAVPRDAVEPPVHGSGPREVPQTADAAAASDAPAADGDGAVVGERDARAAGDATEQHAAPPAVGVAPDARSGASAAVEQTPSPQPSGSAFACPGGWVVVDADGDDSIDGADRCERVIETSADGQLPADTLPVVALVVTMGLLLASIGIGAARWGSVMPPRR